MPLSLPLVSDLWESTDNTGAYGQNQTGTACTRIHAKDEVVQHYLVKTVY